jgi:hypothetical protein
MVADMAEGLARYLGVDTTIVRIAVVVLTVVGGAHPWPRWPGISRPAPRSQLAFDRISAGDSWL